MIRLSEDATLAIGPTRVLMLLFVLVAFILALYLESLIDIYLSLIYFFMIVGPVIVTSLLNRGNELLSTLALVLSGVIIAYLIGTERLTGYWPLLGLLPGPLPFYGRRRNSA